MRLSGHPAIESFPTAERRALGRNHDDPALSDWMGHHAFNLEFDSGPVARKYPRALRQDRPEVVSVTGVHQRSETGLGDGGMPIVDAPPDATAWAWGDHRVRPLLRDALVQAPDVEWRVRRR